jgi:hypothetical protein
MLSADLSTALSYAVGSDLSLRPLQAALSGANALAAGSADQTVAIAQADSVVQGVSGQIDQQSFQLANSFPSDASASELSASYLSKVRSAGSLAAAVNVRSYVGRIGMNIAGPNV